MTNRRVPEWLLESNEEKPAETAKAYIISNTNKNTSVKDEKPFVDNLSLKKEENINRRVLRSRSNLDTTISNQEVVPKVLPYIEYKGSIHYLTKSLDIACACDQILSWIELQEGPIVPIAFDMEWPFSFQTGPGKTAVIQLCANEDACYVFHISQLQKLPAAINGVLTHKKVRLHGVNIKNDIRKLQRDFPEITADKIETMIKQCKDLGPWCNEVCNTGGRWSLERLVRYICKLQMNKSKKVRMSKWHIIPLKKDQKLYAAIDVYIAQVIYRKLEKMEQEKAERSAAFSEIHGEKSLRAVQTLGLDFLN